MPETIMQLRPSAFPRDDMVELRACLKEAVPEVLNPIIEEDRGRPYEPHNIKVKTEWVFADDDPDILDYQIRIMLERWPALVERRDEAAKDILEAISNAIPSTSGRGFVQIKLSETGFAISGA